MWGEGKTKNGKKRGGVVLPGDAGGERGQLHGVVMAQWRDVQHVTVNQGAGQEVLASSYADGDILCRATPQSNVQQNARL